jgi:hypothetical protein
MGTIGACIGEPTPRLAIVLSGVFALLGKQHARTVPPDPASDKPVSELERFARQQGERLKTPYKVQMGLAVATAFLLGGLVVWSAMMFTFRRVEYGTATEARRFADDADVLSLGLRRRLATIATIQDPVERQKYEWLAVEDYLSKSR